MVKTDSRKVQQRRRFQKQRQEARQRILEVKAAVKTETAAS